MWAIISSFRPRFTRQHPVGPHVIDIACRKAKLAIELDGSQHVDSASDVERTAFLEALGWRVIRFWNSEVEDNAEGVAAEIIRGVGERLGPTHPQPLPVSREGRVRRPRTRRPPV